MNAKRNTRDIQADTLPAPTVEQAVGGRIEASIEFVTVDIPAYTGMAAGDTVTLIWNADVTGKYTDYVPVSAATVGHALTFEVPAEQIATNHEAAVSYEVAPSAGGDTLSSLPLALQIGDPVLLPAPTVNEADGTSISVDDNADGVTVTVPADAALAAGDLVTVYWVGTDGDGTTSVEATVTSSGAGKLLHVHIPVAVLQADEGTSVLVYYTVTRAASGAIETSDTVAYNITGEAPSDLPAPTVAEADNTAMTINPADVTGGITVIIPASAGLAMGDTVSASVSSVADGTTTTADHTVTAAEAGKALSLVVKATLADDADGTAVTVYYTVTRAASGAIETSDTAAYNITGEAPSDLPAPTVAEADNTAMTIPPADVTGGITVIIPASAGLATGDTVSASVSSVADGTTTTADHTVTAAEAGKALSLVVKATLADDADGTAVTVWYTVNGSTSDSATYTLLSDVILFEDFEDNNEVIEISAGKSLTLVKSGAVLTNKSRGTGTVGVFDDTDSIFAPFLVGKRIAQFLPATTPFEIKFPIEFRYFRAGLGSNDSIDCLFTFYNSEGIELYSEPITLIPKTGMWFEHRFNGNIASSVVVSGEKCPSMDHITVKGG